MKNNDKVYIPDEDLPPYGLSEEELEKRNKERQAHVEKAWQTIDSWEQK
ncbi:hypothetical protein [Anaerosinus sp.]